MKKDLYKEVVSAIWMSLCLAAIILIESYFDKKTLTADSFIFSFGAAYIALLTMLIFKLLRHKSFLKEQTGKKT